ncbi:ParB N-terminal domain-containing protein [Calothrix sp. PCC 6303]|uniref:ParB N-terminal domain-containing protein n=1 Tax=Calothrix sp. PCC 6303 TaxID=1170562 RepID=UPI0002A02430|nr:ParB N-terminal domain-containing protein [Calothrix sp. PCC 6303]AFY99724.1 hypothetical protein Cal6303_0653 [Calothrix sp. PCC 6303]
MKLSTSLVAVKKITCNTPRSNFLHEKIEQAAQQILAVEGLINPIVVRKTGLQAYEVIQGDFEYYAAARAREINLKLGEMVSVYIVDEENQEVLLEQIKIFRSSDEYAGNSNLTSYELSNDVNSDKIISTFTRMFANLESRFEQITQQLVESAKEKMRLESEIKEIKARLTDKMTPLEVFNQSDMVQLTKKLINTGISEGEAKKKAEAIISVRDRQENQKFLSLNNVVEKVKLKRGKRQEKAIGEKKMLQIIDIWSE